MVADAEKSAPWLPKLGEQLSILGETRLREGAASGFCRLAFVPGPLASEARTSTSTPHTVPDEHARSLFPSPQHEGNHDPPQLFESDGDGVGAKGGEKLEPLAKRRKRGASGFTNMHLGMGQLGPGLWLAGIGGCARARKHGSLAGTRSVAHRRALVGESLDSFDHTPQALSLPVLYSSTGAASMKSYGAQQVDAGNPSRCWSSVGRLSFRNRGPISATAAAALASFPSCSCPVLRTAASALCVGGAPLVPARWHVDTRG